MTMKQAGKCHARGFALALLAIAGLALPANADTKPTYDKRIEEAAIRMLVPKLGEMRGSLGVGGDDFLASMVNEQVTVRQPMVRRPEVKLPEIARPAAKPPHVVEHKPAAVAKDEPKARLEARPVARPTQRPVAENRAETPAAATTGRHSKGSFLFF
ncbi:hypothetical protein [Hoeflea alexandrii]|uniref:hypothetical protein n=1 Tax=Hoeflea alexandrii TaxID=288436 RepID=UPI0022AF62B1|nr:hypothetical protein [Hoeflea alexandrii]MCZ4288316.1 hypothetical protein [Hoeflea alexandrii]